jgi:diguanylate cyclase (GGDEF)-like protein
MLAPSFPDNEESRLKTLRSMNVLDSAAQEQFDRVTRLASRYFGVPIALVSLVDANRQWFKSCVGLDARETGRDISFCGHAILDNKTFYIEDASIDSRFHDNPLVTGPPHIRFYAGRPIKAPNGHNLGTLCIIDSKPKKLSTKDFTVLDDLAKTVEEELASLQLATVDELTGLSSTRGFSQLATHCLSMAERQKAPITFAYFDLDNFKPINDNNNYTTGDRVLKFFAEQLKESFRSSDLFSRIGGDEFAVLLYNANIDKSHQLLERFKHDLATNFQNMDIKFNLEFSVSFVSYDPISHPDVDTLIRRGAEELVNNPVKV